MTKKQLENMTLELRRGVLSLAVLSQLHHEHYGYSLIKQLNERGLEIDQGTLYPLLYKLENKGWVEGAWESGNGARRRRVYSITPQGRAQLTRSREEWQALERGMSLVLKGAANV